MKTGMLWFDDGPGGLDGRVTRAKAYYEKKYGKVVDYAEVNQGDVSERCQVAGVEVQPVRCVMRSHMWIGRKDG